MSLAHDLEELAEMHRTGALDNTEYEQAKARLLGPPFDPKTAPASTSPKHPAPPAENAVARASRGPRPRTRVLVMCAVVVVALVAVAAGMAVWSRDAGTERIEQRSSTDCKARADELSQQGKPMAEVYPSLRGMGCGEWLDSQFDKAGEAP